MGQKIELNTELQEPKRNREHESSVFPFFPLNSYNTHGYGLALRFSSGPHRQTGYFEISEQAGVLLRSQFVWKGLVGTSPARRCSLVEVRALSRILLFLGHCVPRKPCAALRLLRP